jgi:hypothetical protein
MMEEVPPPVVSREIPGFGVMTFADFRPRGVLSLVDALEAMASCPATAAGTIHLVDAGNLSDMGAADIVWSPWTLNGAVIHSDPLLGYGAAMCLETKRRITFPDGTAEVSTISQPHQREALFAASVKGTLVGQVGGLVFALAGWYCSEPCCVHLRSQLTVSPLGKLCPPRTCAVCPDILIAALLAHNRSYFSTGSMHACWSMSSWEACMLDAYHGYSACPFATSMSVMRLAWLAAVARSCLRRSRV